MTEEDFCTYANKRCYSHEHASSVLRWAKSHKNRSSKIPKRAYHCKYCNMWHLTSSLSENERHLHKPLKVITTQEEFDLSEVL